MNDPDPSLLGKGLIYWDGGTPPYAGFFEYEYGYLWSLAILAILNFCFPALRAFPHDLVLNIDVDQELLGAR